MSPSLSSPLQLKPLQESSLNLYEHGVVTAVIKSVQFTFQSYFAVTPVPCGIVILNKCEYLDKIFDGISGLIKMFQVTHDSTLITSIEKKTIFRLLGPLYQDHPAHDNISNLEHSLRDGVGELTNVIYAYMKRYLNEKGASFRMGLPIVQNTADLAIELALPTKKTKYFSIVIPFELQKEKILVELLKWKPV